MFNIKRSSMLLVTMLIVMLVFITPGCDDEETSGVNDIVPGCSPEPVALAPDVILCPDYNQAQLEVAVNEAGGGCDCGDDCPTETVAGDGDDFYLVNCSNDCGVITAKGQLACIRWLTDWDAAMAEAKTAGKAIMINFYTDVCPACRMLDENTFTDTDVGVFLNENFINVKNNAGESSLSSRYGIRGVPTTIFTTPDGEELGRIIGYYPPDEFLEGAQWAKDLWIDFQE
jgi:thiol-disulfide isomerase/thioredoxin